MQLFGRESSMFCHTLFRDFRFYFDQRFNLNTPFYIGCINGFFCFFFLLNKFGDRVFRNSKFQSVLHSSNQIYSNFSLSILAFLNCLVCWSFNVCIMGNLLRAVDQHILYTPLCATPPSILGGIF